MRFGFVRGARFALAGVVVVVLSLGVVRQAGAEICALDNVPAATLLLPYFEVDLRDPRGTTTLFSVHNALDRSVLARVTLWTDHGVPTFAFDVYLTGFDVQAFNLRDLFAGSAPTTGSGVSPVGWMSAPGGAFAGCDAASGIFVPVEHLRAAHQGQASGLLGGQCGGRAFGDRRARGYLTIDVVTECVDSTRPYFPSEPGYFGDGTGDGVAGYDNALWGDYQYVEPGDNRARGDSLVRLEADRARFGDGDRTFYGRYIGNSGRDAREPLPGAWAARSIDVPAAGATTELVVWRETPRDPVPFPCEPQAFDQTFFPGYSYYLEWDEEENSLDPRSIPVTPPVQAFFQASQSQRTFSFFDAGWITLDLNYSPVEPAQAYVASVIAAEGRYSFASQATALESGCDPGECRFGDPVEVTQLCVQSAQAPFTELEVGQRVIVTGNAGGCFSQSCSYVTEAACAYRPLGGNVFELDTQICRAQTFTPCLAVCDLQPRTYCTSPEELGAGVYTIRDGELELIFTVPSTVPEGGLCVGEASPTS